MVNSNEKTLSELKGILIGRQLSSIIFVQNYLQVDFDGDKFTVYIFPQVIVNNEVFNIQKVGYRDALCTLIASIVSDIILEVKSTLTIVFENGNRLVFNIDPEDAYEYEKLIFSLSKGDWYVWD